MNQLVECLKAPALDPVVLTVANDHLAGKSIHDIANENSVPSDVVSQILDKSDVKAYIDNVYLTQGYMNRYKRMDLINKILDEKVQEAMETQIYSKRDLYEWLKMLNDMEGSVRPKNDGAKIAIQVNNYDNLMDKLFDQKVIENV